LALKAKNPLNLSSKTIMIFHIKKAPDLVPRAGN
jgi:hypothetical protein